MESVRKCITIFIIGLNILKAFWLNNWLLVRSLFTLLNLSSWYFSALNALTTLIPVIFSLVTEFNLSISPWTILNLGITIIIKIVIVVIRINTATAVAILHSRLFPNILVTAHTAVIGAFIISWSPIAINISNWVISLVVLVIRLLVEKFFILLVSRLSTFLKILSLILNENDAAIFDIKYPTITALDKLPKAHKSIYVPSRKISFISAPLVWTNWVMFDI